MWGLWKHLMRFCLTQVLRAWFLYFPSQAVCITWDSTLYRVRNNPVRNRIRTLWYSPIAGSLGIMSKTHSLAMIQCHQPPNRLIHLFSAHHGVLPNANQLSMGHMPNYAGGGLMTATVTATNNNTSLLVQITTDNKLNSRNTEETLHFIFIYMAPFITQVPWGLYKLKGRHQYRLASPMPRWSYHCKSTYHRKCDKNTGKTAE